MGKNQNILQKKLHAIQVLQIFERRYKKMKEVEPEIKYEEESLPKADLVETNNPLIFRDIRTGELFFFLENGKKFAWSKDKKDFMSYQEAKLIKLNDSSRGTIKQ